MVNSVGKDMEICCDTSLINNKGSEFKSIYADVLMKQVISSNKKMQKTFACMGGKTSEMKKRFKNIFSEKKRKGRMAFILVGVLIFSCLLYTSSCVYETGLNTVMPFGVRKIDAFRTLTTESLAVFVPFRVQDIYHANGIYYGQNVISKNMIIADRKQLLNGNAFILGVSGLSLIHI